ncbi:MAG TPA: hypothetical protein VLH77_06750 [Gammaproteobacteria bacterium]|nr:hypothetical protein [Gammaproteobacteria bacterium]
MEIEEENQSPQRPLYPDLFPSDSPYDIINYFIGGACRKLITYWFSNTQQADAQTQAEATENIESLDNPTTTPTPAPSRVKTRHIFDD